MAETKLTVMNDLGEIKTIRMSQTVTSNFRLSSFFN